MCTNKHTYLPFGIIPNPQSFNLQVNTLYFTGLSLQRKHLSALRSQTTGVINVGHWNIPQAKESAGRLELECG